MKMMSMLTALVLVLLGGWTMASCGPKPGAGEQQTAAASPAAAESSLAALQLPAPATTGSMSLEQAIGDRRSVRDYTEEPVTLDEVSQLLWAAQGITSPEGARAAPSAGGTYPLEIYVAVGRVTGLDPGVYRYEPEGHQLVLVSAGDVLADLSAASLDQAAVGNAAVAFVAAGVYARTTERYGERGIRYVHLEAGHAAQNLCLQAAALGLGAVPIGAFADDEVREVMHMLDDEEPLYVLPVGAL